ncbi:STAS domain-containing protein [Streptomyces sp. NPDC006265]|uniref:STAS domain-containing protein n=1 Tax=Streptomyces sp. NPDC006265 TaxID=3156740 RepID=UPI0033A48359
MSQADLTVSQHTTTDGVHVLDLAGEIDHTTADTFRRALSADDGSLPYTVLDFHAVTFMDCSGINVLIAANNAARAHGGWLRLAQTPSRVLYILHVVGLDDVSPLYATVDDALAPEAAA